MRLVGFVILISYEVKERDEYEEVKNESEEVEE